MGPLVISEVQYHPGYPSAAARAANRDVTQDDLEFVEISNPTAEPVDLQHWQIRGGIDYDFDRPTILAAGQSLLVLPFDPTDPANAYRVAAFRAHYGIDDTVTLLGAYGGQLSDGGERVQLLRPGTTTPDDPDAVALLQEDEVLYDDLLPWPTEADGTGQSLQRHSAMTYGNDATSWWAADPTPGSFDAAAVAGDFDGNGVVDTADINLLFVQLRSNDPDLSYDLTHDGLVDGADRDELVLNIIGSTYGDANLNLIFNSTDLVIVFQAGQYEDGIARNSLWQTGDWNGDGEFNSSDFVLAFQTGDYSYTARPTPAQPADGSVPIGAALASLSAGVPSEPSAGLPEDRRRTDG